MKDLNPSWMAILAMACIGCGSNASLEQRATEELEWSADSLLNSNHTPTWEDAVAMAEALALSDERAHALQVGCSDIGRPIHALVLTESGHATLETGAIAENGIEALHAWSEGLAEGHAVVMVNNAIHPGEPCGVNASFALAAQWLKTPTTANHPLSKSSWVFVPQYNVGGASRRNCCTRANQNGPASYGFRGNAANLDLNRDFIKMDSRNAEAFVALFHAVEPDVFVDTHTSNGADYPYTMTLITTQPDKAGPVVGPFLRNELEPALFEGMKEQGWPMAPYVYSLGSTPEDGIMGFLETPRYSTGYATLFGTIGFTTEAHMLKPFADRVQATHTFLQVLANWIQGHSEELTDLRKHEQARIAAADVLPVRWKLSSQRDSLEFEGYAARREWSSVTQGTRLSYDRSQVWRKRIAHANRYDASVRAEVPPAWVIPQAWRQVVSRLQANEVSMEPIERDTVMLLEVTWIESFNSSSRPYEGHHPISVDSVRTEVQPVQLYRGDWVVPSDQKARRYLTEVLSPLAHDAFLHWNFFDAALQQKEYFSSYVFEDLAADLLAGDEVLRLAYDEARLRHPEWGESPRTALQWIYERSPHFEGTANRYPVYRTLDQGD